jgi:hypothetical protein
MTQGRAATGAGARLNTVPNKSIRTWIAWLVIAAVVLLGVLAFVY